MANLTVPQLIKILLGISVVVVVVIGIYLFFSGTVIDFFKNLPGGEGEGEYGGAGVSGEIDEEEPEVTFEYGSKTYTVILHPTRIERDDGRYYTLDGNRWMYHDPSSEKEGYVTPETEGQESYDRWIGLVDDAIRALSEEGVEGEEDVEESCEVDCSSLPPIDLSCNFATNVVDSWAKVRGYRYECVEGDCVAKSRSEVVEECDKGCSEGVCDCLSSETRVYTIYWEMIDRLNRNLCCNDWIWAQKDDTCRDVACGISSYRRCEHVNCGTNWRGNLRTCRDAACGVSRYNRCQHPACGTENDYMICG